MKLTDPIPLLHCVHGKFSDVGRQAFFIRYLLKQTRDFFSYFDIFRKAFSLHECFYNSRSAIIEMVESLNIVYLKKQETKMGISLRRIMENVSILCLRG